MGESTRPQQMAVYKSGADGGFNQLVPWMYLVTEPSNCMDEFSVPFNPVPEAADDVLCQLYSGTADDMNEVVKYCVFLTSSLP